MRAGAAAGAPPVGARLRESWAETRSTVREGRHAVTGASAESLRLAAREASDLGSLRAALNRLAQIAPSLLLGFGPEPGEQPPPSRIRWLRLLGQHRAVVMWLLAFGGFMITAPWLMENTWLRGVSIGEVVAVPVAVLLVLPLGLAARTPLRAWRLLIVLAVLTPLILPPVATQGPPWPVTLIFVAIYVVWQLAVRLDLAMLIGVWLVTNATILWSYLVAGHRENALGEANASIVMFTILLALGYLVSNRRRLQRELAEGEQRTQEEQARRTLLEERARIARELHDVVAHHMSVIAVRAETAPFRIPDLSQAGRDDMAETSAIARQALTEMRRLLGVLRGAGIGGERAPQPSLDRLDQLIAGVRNAGVPVRSRVLGAERPLPQGVELSAYRIVQEALSNVLRHAPGADTSVTIAYGQDALRLRVENAPSPGRSDGAASPAGRGHGIIGMRERATMLGGRLHAAPTPAGGYLVEAVLPLDPPPTGGHEQEEPTPS